MICEKCGQWMEDGTAVCSKCGAVYKTENAQGAEATAAQQSAAPAGNPAGQQGAAPAGQPMPNAGNAYGAPVGPVSQPGMTKKEFDKHTNIVNVKKQIAGMGIACYIIAGINLILMFALQYDNLLDVLLILGMGLGIHLAKSRVCSIILTVYGGINVIVMVVLTGKAGGWWILVVGIYAIINTFKYQKAWTEYQQTGIVPDLSAKKGK